MSQAPRRSCGSLDAAIVTWGLPINGRCGSWPLQPRLLRRRASGPHSPRSRRAAGRAQARCARSRPVRGTSLRSARLPSSGPAHPLQSVVTSGTAAPASPPAPARPRPSRNPTPARQPHKVKTSDDPELPDHRGSGASARARRAATAASPWTSGPSRPTAGERAARDPGPPEATSAQDGGPEDASPGRCAARPGRAADRERQRAWAAARSGADARADEGGPRLEAQQHRAAPP